MKKPQFTNDNFYHIYNRGVEKRKIFLDTDDYVRFIHDLFEFNDEADADHIYYRRQFLKSSEVEPPKISKRKLLVEIIAFCLMPNHFHLFVRQHANDGVVKFMHKLGTGYTMYFNQKYERVGGLFQGRFKAVHINNNRHFLYLPHYIHLNPLDRVMPQWREGEIKSV
ncbi:transposase, partial [Patescibacteria group bacterium]|nr:transposase [Patescibacteria group bacterium]